MESTSADFIFQNGRFSTLDSDRPQASAVAVQAGKFLAVGSDTDVQRFRGAGTQVIDLKGRCVIPGLNDSHLHLIRGGLNYNMNRHNCV